MLFISVFAHANIHIDGDVAKQVILSHIDTTYQAAALEEYNNQLESSGDYTMSASGLYKVCIASGWDIKTPDGKTKCDSFVKSLLDGGSYTYYEVCGPDKGKSGGTERCIDNVFYHWYTVADTQVTMLQADGLCKEYARIKFNDDIECSNKSRPGTVNPNNDYIKCTSKLTPTYYEFKFDDVVESKDFNITASVGKAICEMHGVDYIYSQCSQHSTFSSEVKCYPPKCKTSDANLCTKINESMKRFGYNTKIQNNECVISENTIISESQLRTAFGINNMAFKTGYQLSAYSNMRSQLCEYISKNANTTITSCECNYNRTQLIRDGKTDDILTCYANGQPIDFVFDDLSEHNKKIAQGNMEAFACSVLGGEYQGETCFTPDKKLCDQIASATIAECPECSKAYFDTEKNACVLPNATKANNHQKKVNIGLIVGGAVVGAGIIIYTGGTGFAAVAITLETIGAGMELGGQIHIDGVADEFFLKANNCNETTCAESILREFFQYLSRMTNDLQDGELEGIETQMIRLIGLLPDDSQFLIDTVAGCYEDNGDNFDISKCDDGVWNNDQIIRAVGMGLQFTSVFASVGKWLLGAGRVQKIASKTPRLAEVLSKRISGVKETIQKSAKQGKVLKTSNGKEPLWIRMLQHSIPEVEARISRLLDDIFDQKLAEIEKLKAEQIRKEQEFIAKNQGMLFHGSATDYKDGTVQALSKYGLEKSALYATPDFSSAKNYAMNTGGRYSVKLVDTREIYIPEVFNKRTGNIQITDSEDRYVTYIYAVKPEGFKLVDSQRKYFTMFHDTERVDRISVPVQSNVLHYPNISFVEVREIIHKMNTVADKINAGNMYFKNLLIYEDYLKELAEILK